MMIPIPNIFLLICCLIWIFLDIFVFLKKIRNRTYVSYFKVFLSVVLILLFIIVYRNQSYYDKMWLDYALTFYPLELFIKIIWFIDIVSFDFIYKKVNKRFEK